MTASTFPPLLLKTIEKYFAEADRPRVLQILASYGERFPNLKDLERVRRDMVIVSDGDLDKLARQAERDYRDVIMAAEYELRDGRIVKRSDLE